MARAATNEVALAIQLDGRASHENAEDGSSANEDDDTLVVEERGRSN